MAILKRLKASTLMETLVATVLIVVVFMLASMILNNLFSNSIKNNTGKIEAHLNELEYLYQTEHLQLPFYDEIDNWNISIESVLDENKRIIEFEATNKRLKKTITKQKFEIQ